MIAAAIAATLVLTSAPAATLTPALTQVGSASFDPARVAAARANYEAIVQGRKHVRQLSRQELGDVLAIAEALEKDRKTGSRSERCVADERKRAGGSPSALEARVIDLKCREPGEPLG